MSEYSLPPAKFLSKEKTYALVGSSASWQDHAYYLQLELENNGYRIILLHPSDVQVGTSPAFPHLLSIPPVDGVIFASSDPETSLRYLKEMRDSGLYRAWFEDMQGLITEEMREFARIHTIERVEGHNLLDELRKGMF